MRIAHTSINVLMPEISVRFYEALGFEYRGRLVFASKLYLYLGLPGDEVSLELGVERGRVTSYQLGDGYANLAIMVPSLDHLLATLANAGIKPLSAPYHPHDRPEFKICVLVDPDGYRIELIEGQKFHFPQDVLQER